MRNATYVAALFLTLSLAAKGEELTATNDLRNEFESSWQAWKQHCEKVSNSSRIQSYLESEDFKRIVRMGPGVLPLVVEKCINDTEFWLRSWAWSAITKVTNDPAVNPWATDSVETWWEGGRELAESRFAGQYAEWKKAKSEGRSQDAEKYRKAIRSMGILALGPMMERLDTDDEVIPMITDVVGDELGDKRADKQAIRRWWTANKDVYELPPAKR